MRSSLLALLIAVAEAVLASPAVFSVQDDILAFPQYEVVLSDLFITDVEAYDILAQNIPSQTEDITYESESPSDSMGISSQRNHEHSAGPEDDKTKHVHEWIHQDGKRYLCSIPVIERPPRNETSEAEARAEEAQEIARATDRGWELLQELDGPCLYYVSGYWSYSFCHNSEVKQFRQLPQQQGRPAFPPLEDPNVNSFILGKALEEVKSDPKSKQDEWGNEVEVRQLSQQASPPTTELQIEGDTRYLVQKMEGGTICDLTGKPRRVEVQYHCNPNAGDRINRLKEITTCSYLLTIHTPRLCKDVAFVPPTAIKANPIACQQVLSASELSALETANKIQVLEGSPDPPSSKISNTKENPSNDEKNKPITIGGTIVGAHKNVGKEGQKLNLPSLNTLLNPAADIIAKAEDGQIIVLSDEALVDMELDPQVVQELREKMKKLAGERGWTLEVVEGPGHVKEIHGIFEAGEDEDEEEGGEGGEGGVGSGKGSEEEMIEEEVEVDRELVRDEL